MGDWTQEGTVRDRDRHAIPAARSRNTLGALNLRIMRSWASIAAALCLVMSAGHPALAETPEDTVGLVDPATGLWYLQAEDGGVMSFYYGNPRDVPFMGDWDCDGVDTPGLYRQSDGFAYLRNSNTQGVADLTFFFGNPGDVPIPGDFDGDGCDTLSLYRPSEQRFYIINELGLNGGGLGAADYWTAFGNSGDTPFAGDLDGDGFDEVGLYRVSTGLVYYEDQLTVNGGGGAADHQFYFGNSGDRFVAGDWTADGTDTVGMFRPASSTFFLRHTNTQGNADEQREWGFFTWLPVAGAFDLPAGLPPPPEPTDVFETTEVSPGDSGPAVEYLQLLLTEARLYRGPIDGHYPNDPWERPGTMTAAVYAFHKLHQTPAGSAWTPSDHVDTRWTIEDWQRMREFTPEPPVARAGEPDRFEVDAYRELMWLILDGEVAAIFHVSVGGEFTYWWSGTGQYEVAHTPRGDLDVDHWWAGNRQEGWMYRAWYYKYTHRWMALHGYYTVPPYPASHGCVRVVYDDADWIYAQVGEGLGLPFHIWDG